ncbi:MAG: peptide deformylase [bacterium]|nr:peptide deformylase [bacterium]MDD5354455.1 peptide deformylase [bacterium]MDD5756346.1 peptide deformylase [bacterium]
MPILPIIHYPNPILKTPCDTLRKELPGVEQLIKDMQDTLMAYPFCVGLAAPQVGSLLRIVVIDCSRSRKPCKHHGNLVLINPVIIYRAGEQVMREGCLSLPDYTGNVKRPDAVVVEGLDSDEIPQKIETEGFEAVVLQHEIDHLDGILFLDRITSLKTDVFRRKTY